MFTDFFFPQKYRLSLCLYIRVSSGALAVYYCLGKKPKESIDSAEIIFN